VGPVSENQSVHRLKSYYARFYGPKGVEAAVPAASTSRFHVMVFPIQAHGCRNQPSDTDLRFASGGYVNFSLAILSLACGICAIPVGRRATGDFFHPAALIGAVWGVSFGLFLLALFPFVTPGRHVLAFIVVSIGLLVAGTITGQRLDRRIADDGPTWTLRNPRTWVWVFSILGLIGVTWYGLEVARALGWGAFSDFSRIRLALSNYTIPSTFMFLEVFTNIAPLLAFALVLCGTQLRPLDWAGPGACVLSTWVTTGRMQFFLIILTAFFMFVARRGPRLSWTGLGLAVAVVGALLVMNFIVVGTLTGKTPANLSVTMQVPSRTDRVAVAARDPSVVPGAQASSRGSVMMRIDGVLQRGATIYLYATGSYAALGQLMQQPIESSHLTYTLYPAARLLQRLHLLNSSLPSPISPSVNIMRPPAAQLNYNVYTLLYDPLMDFGRWGALVYTAALGILIGIVYGRFVRRRHSPIRLLLLAEIATALTLSIFANMFSNSLSWYVLAGTVGPFVITRALRWSSPTIIAAS
jgi:hypothetical protein